MALQELIAHGFSYAGKIEQLLFFEGELFIRREMLQDAATANAEMRALRIDSIR